MPVLNLLLIVSLHNLVSCRRRRHNHENVCREPKPSKIGHLQSSDLLYSFYQIPTVLNVVTFESVPAKYKKVNYFRVKGAKKCPSLTESLLLHNGDVCPVFYVLNVDTNRVPHSFIESVCLCNTPRNTTSGSSFNCKQQMIYARVRRRTGCHHGFYVYSELFEPMRMGCAATVTGIKRHTKNRYTPEPITKESTKYPGNRAHQRRNKPPKSPERPFRPETPESPESLSLSHRRNKVPKSPRRPSRPETPKSPQSAFESNKWKTPKSRRPSRPETPKSSQSAFESKSRRPSRPETPKSPQIAFESNKRKTPKSPSDILERTQSPKSPSNFETLEISGTPVSRRKHSDFQESPKSPENLDVPF